MLSTEQIIILILAIITIVLFYWVLKIELRLKKVFKGKKAHNLEDTINMLIGEVKQLQKSKEDIGSALVNIEKRLQRSIQGIATVRFKSFQDMGGNQSFAIALVNEDGDGIILSSLYARERISVFAKPLKKYQSEYELTKEEKDALKQARLS